MRWPNCSPIARVGGRDLERALGDPDGLGGDPRPAAIERAHREPEAVALVADPVGRRNADAVEGELGRRAAAEAHLVLDAGRPRSPSVGTSTTKHDSRAVRAAGVGIGDREDRDEVGDRAVADEPLRAGDDVVVAVADGAASGWRRRPSRPRPRSGRRR